MMFVCDLQQPRGRQWRRNARTHTVNLFIERIKRNPIALVVAFVATLIVSLATLTDAVGQLSNLVGAGMGADAHDGSITALMHAAANNDGPMITLLLKAGADINYSDALGIAATYADKNSAPVNQSARRQRRDRSCVRLCRASGKIGKPRHAVGKSGRPQKCHLAQLAEYC